MTNQEKVDFLAVELMGYDIEDQGRFEPRYSKGTQWVRFRPLISATDCRACVLKIIKEGLGFALIGILTRMLGDNQLVYDILVAPLATQVDAMIATLKASSKK